MFDCGNCDRPETHCESCPITDQPTQLGPAVVYSRLYNRMKRWEKLPEAGGLLDQDDHLMKIMDMLDIAARERSDEKGDGDQ